jgi:hypothetical protein
MHSKEKNQTFRYLDGNIDYVPPASALEEWYNQVRDTPLENMGIGDLARACRQNIFPSAVVPICLLRLEEDPLAGDLYDGELLLALKGLPRDYWATHPQEKSEFLRLAERAVNESGDSELKITPRDLEAVKEQN